MIFSQGVQDVLSGGLVALWALLLPLAGTILIGLFRNRPNLREASTR